MKTEDLNQPKSTTINLCLREENLSFNTCNRTKGSKQYSQDRIRSPKVTYVLGTRTLVLLIITLFMNSE
jgi:hypothetical protein